MRVDIVYLFFVKEKVLSNLIILYIDKFKLICQIKNS